jgi:hypothetical protein
MSMGHWDIGLILNFTIRAECPEDQQASVLLKPNPGGAIPLLREEALDVTQPTSLTLDQTGEGRGEEKAAANSHETQGSKGLRTPAFGTWRGKEEATLNSLTWFPLTRWL